MLREYDIIIKATIEIGGKYLAETRDEAIETAKAELRAMGDISSIEVERAVFVDQEIGG